MVGIDLTGILGKLTLDDVHKFAQLGFSHDQKSNLLRATPEGQSAAQEAAWRLCAKSAEYFILDSKFVTTLDNQVKWDCTGCGKIISAVGAPNCARCGSPTTRRDPIQNFPSTRTDLRDVLRVFEIEQLIAIKKSRRLLCTELTCAKALHKLMFRKGTLAVFQSDKEDKANDNIQRVHGMWNRLPEWMKRRRPANPTKNGQMISLYFEIPNNHAKLVGIPSGPKQIREMGPTFYFADEAAFHPDALATFGAVRQAIESGCQAVYASTAAAGFFAGLTNDALEMVGS